LLMKLELLVWKVFFKNWYLCAWGPKVWAGRLWTV